jgi:hypothetical protein
VRSQVAQVADAVPLMYAGFLAFFLGLATFFVRAPPRRLRCAALRWLRTRALFTLPGLVLPHLCADPATPPLLSRRSTCS